MEFELAKKLREAGFPQHGVDFCTSIDGLMTCVPTLAELIRECGPSLRLDLVSCPTGTWCWRAEANAGSITEWGEFSTEAVGRLWLTLKQTK